MTGVIPLFADAAFVVFLGNRQPTAEMCIVLAAWYDIIVSQIRWTEQISTSNTGLANNAAAMPYMSCIMVELIRRRSIGIWMCQML